MTRRPTSPAAVVVGTLLAVTLVVLVLKWLAITVAILAVPFAIWWILDRAQRTFPEQRGAASTPRAATTPTEMSAPPHNAAPTLLQPAPSATSARAATSVQRARIEARAVVDAAGRCGWCGAAGAHRDPRTGQPLAPRRYHRNDIEQAVVLAEAHRAATVGPLPRPVLTQAHRVG